MATCYRHPDRETGVSCSSCGRPICPDCMTPSPVGMRCPECARQRTPIKTAATITRGAVEPYVTYAIIAICVLAFVGEMAGGAGLGFGRAGGTLVEKGALFGPSIEINHEYWRLITNGFLHAGFLHIAFNMYILWILGRMLEPALGHVRFGAIYFTALLAGSFGALIVSPNSLTLGASGAVFGLMGAAVIEYRRRGIGIMESGIGILILLNLGLSFIVPGIAIGGHIGGLIGGTLAALAINLGQRYRSLALSLGGCVVISAVAVAGALAVA
jgi:membrane associated rhomboid family serine protease